MGADGPWGQAPGRSDLTTAVRALDLAPEIDPGAGVGSPAVPSQRVPPLARGPGGPRSIPSDAPVRSRRHAARPPRHRLVTFRVAGFVLLLVVILAVAAAGTEYYARDAYFVGLRGTRLTIFQGRPGGVLWWKPTIAQITDVTTADVEPYHLASLRAGVPESGVTAARTFVSRLQSEKTAATAAGLAPAASTRTPATSATVLPSAAGVGRRIPPTAAA